MNNQNKELKLLKDLGMIYPSELSKTKERYYLYLGRLSYEKGIKTLINVFKIKPHLHLK